MVAGANAASVAPAPRKRLDGGPSRARGGRFRNWLVAVGRDDLTVGPGPQRPVRLNRDRRLEEVYASVAEQEVASAPMVTRPSTAARSHNRPQSRQRRLRKEVLTSQRNSQIASIFGPVLNLGQEFAANALLH
jgi:hypothetical protein